ncbi:mediator of RNA polymerase II transcription subunit 17 [Ditylenchus destructor]|uniref:Mediator of RNA polymerase II transcription subunit 17 n=1 Tax=Ditylenchus destructor TaxID=166010 RepID=A0AAD4RA70_9BILA|nr:mediator of RNA polymerase II transcription subunit 17 [Ditylenchus destructor]
MFSSGSISATSSRKGVEICVESLNEWKIQEIGYDGVEKYIKPPEFKEVIAKNAQSITWRDVVGAESSLDALMESDDDEKEAMDITEAGDLALKKEERESKVEPVAGPWAGVARNLHQSLQEITVLLDTLNVVKTNYLGALMVASLPEDPNKINEQITNSKGFQLCTRKKALFEASKTIENALQERTNIRQNSLEGLEKNAFFNELRKMRENWRIRKTNNALFGDLGYRIYGQKFHTGELFDIFRRSLTQSNLYGMHSCLQVQVPRNLMRRTAIWVSVQIDNARSAANLFGNQDLAYMNVDSDASKNVRWEKALKWAQESLICRDIFAQLTKESSVQERICLPTENSLIVSLFDGVILKIEKKFYPFEDIELVEEGVPFLNLALREQFVSDQCRRPMRSQPFVSLPMSSLPENLDMRGPQALSSEEINARKITQTSLLDRLIAISSHYTLICKVTQALKKHVLNYPDPQLQWKWVRSSPIFSMLSVVQVNRAFENLGKFSIHIRVTTDEIIVITKEFQQIKCGRDVKLVQNAIMLLSSIYMLSSVAILSKTYAWQILHANNNAFGNDGNPAPTFYACNQSASKSIFIQFNTNGKPPTICMKLNQTGGVSSKSYSDEDTKDFPMDSPKSLNEDQSISSESENKFRQFNYDALPGTSFMRKMEHLLAIFRN